MNGLRLKIHFRLFWFGVFVVLTPLIIYCFFAPVSFKASAAEIYLKTPADIINIKNNLNGSYKLSGNIDFSGQNFEPIGDGQKPFTGTLKGQGFKILGLSISGDYAYAGFFGAVSGTAEISNLRLIYSGGGINIGGSNEGVIGMLAGKISGQAVISNCYTYGSVKAESQNNNVIGGFIGVSGGAKISACYSAGESILGGANSTAGGFIGEIISGEIKNCYSSVKEIYAGRFAGGFIGVKNDNLPQIFKAVSFGKARSRSQGVSGGFFGKGEDSDNAEIRYNKTLNSNYSGTDFSQIDLNSGLSEDEMKNKANYFNFGLDWGIFQGVSYPYLKTFKNHALLTLNSVEKLYDTEAAEQKLLKSAAKTYMLFDEDYFIEVLSPNNDYPLVGEYGLNAFLLKPYNHQGFIINGGAKLSIIKAQNKNGKPLLKADDAGSNWVRLQFISGAMYSIDGGESWQNENIFVELSADTEYTFLAKYPETEFYTEAVSDPVSVKTKVNVNSGNENTGDADGEGGGEGGGEGNSGAQGSGNGSGNGIGGGGGSGSGMGLSGSGEEKNRNDYTYIIIGCVSAAIIGMFIIFWFIVRPIKKRRIF